MTPDRGRGEAAVLVDGKPRVFRLTHRVQRNIAKALGVEGLSGIHERLQLMQMDDVLLILSEALGEDLETLEDSSIPISQAVEAVAEAMTLALWGEEGPPENPPEAPVQSGPGGNKSPSSEST